MAIFSSHIFKDGKPIRIGCASDWILSNASSATNFYTTDKIKYKDDYNNDTGDMAPLTYLAISEDDSWMEPAFSLTVNGRKVPSPVNLASAPQFYEYICDAWSGNGTDSGVAVYKARTITVTRTSAALTITVTKESSSKTFTYTAQDLVKGLPDCLLFEIQAAGGGGGGNVNATYCGGGGGAGAYTVRIIKIPIGHTLTITMGTGGSGGYCYYEEDDTPGSAGGDTLIKFDGTTVLTVGGGKGGKGATSSARGGTTEGGVITTGAAYNQPWYMNSRASYSYSASSKVGSVVRRYGGRGGAGRSGSTSATQGLSMLASTDYVTDTNRVDMTNYDNSSDTYDVRVNAVTTTGSIISTSGGSGGSCARFISSSYSAATGTTPASTGCGGAGGYGSYGTCHYGQTGGQSWVRIWF